jgi:hypothetical protein
MISYIRERVGYLPFTRIVQVLEQTSFDPVAAARILHNERPMHVPRPLDHYLGEYEDDGF